MAKMLDKCANETSWIGSSLVIKCEFCKGRPVSQEFCLQTAALDTSLAKNYAQQAQSHDRTAKDCAQMAQDHTRLAEYYTKCAYCEKGLEKQGDK